MGRRTKFELDDIEFDYLIDVELESLCECGHRNPEHSASGQCHGCEGCDDDTARDDSHAYARCGCTQFHLAVALDAAPTITLAS